MAQLGPVTCGSVYLWRRSITKDGGTPWTGASAVSIWFLAPGAAAAVQLALTLESGNTWSASNPAGLFSRVGPWKVWVQVTDSGAPDYSDADSLTVDPSPLAFG